MSPTISTASPTFPPTRSSEPPARRSPLWSAVPDVLTSPADNDRLQPVLGWIVTEGRLEPDLGRFVDQLMKRSVAAGLPVWRFYIGFQLVHPQLVAMGVLWRRDSGYEAVPRRHGIMTSSAYLGSPMQEVRN